MSCLPFHLIQPTHTRPVLEYCPMDIIRTRVHARARASVTEIAPVRDSFVPRALSLSARFIRTRIDISPPSANPLGLSPLGASFTLFRASPIQLRRGVAAVTCALLRLAFANVYVRRDWMIKTRKSRVCFTFTDCNYFV